jgi:2-C-methyl-D-erythritol 4-phosphate cytidylyltransferase
MSTTAIIVAAGNSARMGFHKLTADLLGKPVLRWTIEAFDSCPAVDALLIVVGDATREMVLDWAELGIFKKPITLSEGGVQRYLSVHEGLKRLSEDTDIVAVHDGARPLITIEQITRCIERARECKAAVSARPVTETLKRANVHGIISGDIEREHAWVMETPQVFSKDLLTRAYDHVVKDGLLVTDEVSAVQIVKEDIHVVENHSPNLKITYPADLELAARLLSTALENSPAA